MYFIWTLLGMVLASLLYTSFQILKDGAQKPLNYVAPLPSRASSPAGATVFFLNSRRELKWISINELRALTEAPNRLTIIDCRSDSRARLPPIASVLALQIEPQQLPEVLGWVPADQSVVLCGVSDLCPSGIIRTPHRSGLAPVYVLKDDPLHSEADVRGACGTILEK